MMEVVLSGKELGVTVELSAKEPGEHELIG